jgi:hypothetical protein
MFKGKITLSIHLNGKEVKHMDTITNKGSDDLLNPSNFQILDSKEISCTRICVDNSVVIGILKIKIQKEDDDGVDCRFLKRLLPHLEQNKTRIIFQSCLDTDPENYIAINHDGASVLEQEKLLKRIQDEGLFVVKSEYFYDGIWTTKHIFESFPIFIGYDILSDDEIVTTLDYADQIYCQLNGIETEMF